MDGPRKKDYLQISFLEVDDMIRSSNKGYIMLESIIGFGFADDECLPFSDCPDPYFAAKCTVTGQGGCYSGIV